MDDNHSSEMQRILQLQKQRHREEGPPGYEVRIDRLNRVIDLMVRYKEEIPRVLSEDFGHRSIQTSAFTDVASVIDTLKFTRKRLGKWLKPERRGATPPMNLLGARAWVQYQPLGTVGVISPWNFPVNLSFTPLAGIFGAGNRVMLKPSEYTPATSELIARMIAEAYDPAEAAVFTGGPEVGSIFSALPFDHLLFTGATSVAKHVLRAAAENLVPVTLELGGKSPVILGRQADLKTAAQRVWNGKLLNAGQICLAPDYVYVENERLDEWVEESRNAVTGMYPSLKHNDDYTSVLNQRHYERLQGYLQDASAKGARLEEINPADENFSQQEAYKMPPTMVLEATDDMKIMQEEIFGPLMPVKTYSEVDEAIDYVNAGGRPLGLYYFGEDAGERDKVLERTTSGGVTIDDVVFHVAQEDLPFGGVGPSGMGSYHGQDGFKTFSHPKAVFKQTRVDALTKMLRPPYTKRFASLIAGRIKN